MPSFIAYEGQPFFLLPQLSHLNQNLKRTQMNRRNSTKPYLFYQSVRELFFVLSRPQSPYLHIRPDLPIRFLRFQHLFLIFLPSFLKCYVRNDNLSIISLVPYFHRKAHYILLHFAHLVLMTGLISSYI